MKKNKSVEFNPIKVDKDGAKARKIIWTTNAINIAIGGLMEGKGLVANPFYDGNIKLLKEDLLFERTEDEINEWKKCKDDIIYFVEKYCQLMTPEGIQHIELREYQKEYLKHLDNNQLSICLQCRQSAKTTTTALYLIHFLLFNVDKNSLVCSNKRKSAVEVIDKIKKIMLEIPHFLKPGICKWNEASMVLDNGCRVECESTTKNSGIGQTIHFLVLDEFAHVPANIVDEFYNNIFPTVTASRAKTAIISTQNGRNLFYRLYSAAVANENDYKAFKVEWFDVPEWNPDTRSWEKRDQKWYNRQVANYGSIEAFESQMGTNFAIGSNTLINQNILKKLDIKEFVTKSIYGVELVDYWYWKPGYEPMESLKDEYLLITCDLAEGLGQDYTVFEVFRFVEPEKLELIGYFRANTVPREHTAKSLMLLITKWTNQSRVLVSHERNTYGDIFIKDIQELSEKSIPAWDPSVHVKYYTENGNKYQLGIKITSGNKNTHCALFKESFERGFIKIESAQVMHEIENFTEGDNGKFRAAYGNDDLVMAAVQLEFVKQSLQYKLLAGDFESYYNTKNSYDNRPEKNYFDYDYLDDQEILSRYNSTFTNSNLKINSVDSYSELRSRLK